MSLAWYVFRMKLLQMVWQQTKIWTTRKRKFRLFTYQYQSSSTPYINFCRYKVNIVIFSTDRVVRCCPSLVLLSVLTEGFPTTLNLKQCSSCFMYTFQQLKKKFSLWQSVDRCELDLGGHATFCGDRKIIVLILLWFN